jgi:hypothetical protein
MDATAVNQNGGVLQLSDQLNSCAAWWDMVVFISRSRAGIFVSLQSVMPNGRPPVLNGREAICEQGVSL